LDFSTAGREREREKERERERERDILHVHFVTLELQWSLITPASALASGRKVGNRRCHGCWVSGQ
jgi:hypothetical protein